MHNPHPPLSETRRSRILDVIAIFCPLVDGHWLDAAVEFSLMNVVLARHVRTDWTGLTEREQLADISPLYGDVHISHHKALTASTPISEHPCTARRDFPVEGRSTGRR